MKERTVNARPALATEESWSKRAAYWERARWRGPSEQPLALAYYIRERLTLDMRFRVIPYTTIKAMKARSSKMIKRVEKTLKQQCLVGQHIWMKMLRNSRQYRTIAVIKIPK
jgi:hypothetical protein